MTTEGKIIKNKLGLVKFTLTLGNVSQACEVMGYSRDNFYRFKALFNKGRELALQEISQRKTFLRNRVGEHVENAVIEFAFEQSVYGQLRPSNEPKEKDIFVSKIVSGPSGSAATLRPSRNGSTC